MFTYYITGDTFCFKEEIKSIKPIRKDFKNWWKFNYDFRCWELSVPNNINSNKFKERVELFCINNNLKLEVFEFTKKLKPMSHFSSIDTFFNYLHENNRRSKVYNR